MSALTSILLIVRGRQDGGRNIRLAALQRRPPCHFLLLCARYDLALFLKLGPQDFVLPPHTERFLLVHKQGKHILASNHESIPFLVEIGERLPLGFALLPVKRCLGPLRCRGLVARRMTSPFVLQSIFWHRSISQYPPQAASLT